MLCKTKVAVCCVIHNKQIKQCEIHVEFLNFKTYIYTYLFIYLLQLGCYPVAVVILHV